MEKPQKPTFYGEPVSDYAQKQGYLDYLTFSKCFNSVLCNEIVQLFRQFNFERINENYTSEDCEIFQWYIIDQRGADLLEQWLPNEIVYYCEELDLTLWGVTHYGTAWDYVLTDIKIVQNEYGGYDFESPQLSDDWGDDDDE